MAPSKFAALNVRVWRARKAYENAAAAHAERPNYVCRVQRLNSAAIRLSRATLAFTAALLPEKKHLPDGLTSFRPA